jgi:hypothetical protein
MLLNATQSQFEGASNRITTTGSSGSEWRQATRNDVSPRRRLIVERSATAVDSVDGLETGWTDQHFRRRTEPRRTKKHHLAKVRVAGSNPVFRSKKTPYQGTKQHQPRWQCLLQRYCQDDSTMRSSAGSST